MTKQLTPLRRKDIETGRKLERDAIVKWLLDCNLLYDEDIVVCIEAGEHLK